MEVDPKSLPIGARSAEQHIPGGVPWGECLFYFFTYPVALCLFGCVLWFLGTTFESVIGLPFANLPVFLMLFIPGALFLFVLILRDLHAHSRMNANGVVE